MKKLLFILFSLSLCFSVQAQDPISETKNTPVSNVNTVATTENTASQNDNATETATNNVMKEETLNTKIATTEPTNTDPVEKATSNNNSTDKTVIAVEKNTTNSNEATDKKLESKDNSTEVNKTTSAKRRLSQELMLINQKLNVAIDRLNKIDNLTLKLQKDHATINDTKDYIDATFLSFFEKSQFALIIVLSLILFLLILFFILQRKVIKLRLELHGIKEERIKINDAVTNELTNEVEAIMLMQDSIHKLIDAHKAEVKEKELSEFATTKYKNLILFIANKINFMSMTMAKIDTETEGFKQLNLNLQELKDNFKNFGYDMHDYLHQRYEDNLDVAEVNFIEDKKLEEGTRIITSVSVPEVLYQGNVIQKAKITVTQNI